MLREEVGAAGLDPESIAMSEIDTEGDAERIDFPGSPTIRLDGEDFQPADAAAPRGLTCRVYRRRDGRVSPLPDRDDLRDALRRAVER
jgi:hypothetical protein